MAEDFVDRLAENATQPPVLFYCKYVDMWSMWDVFERIVGVERRRILTFRYWMCCFDKSESDLVLNNLQRFLRRGSTSSVEKWYAWLFREAVLSGLDDVSQGAVVVIREPVDGMVDDGVFLDSLKGSPDWLNAPFQEKPPPDGWRPFGGECWEIE